VIANGANVENWNVRGFIFRNLIGFQGADTLAIESYNKAASLEPASPFSYTELGRVYLAQAQTLASQKDTTQSQQDALNKALDSLNKAIQLKSDYVSADYLIAMVYAQQGKSDQAIAKTVFDELKKKPGDWRITADKYNEKVAADSSRYEWAQIPGINKMTPRAGMVTTPVINKTDNTASFAYIIKVYPQPMQRSFNEAKGLVINDYQIVLEEQWINELKKKYPVSIDKKVLNSITK